MFTRKQLEQIEKDTLAPYACHCINTRGRIYPDSEPDYRTCFQRDRDRILHTTAFRRLDHKTQVFVTSEGDYYRTRLTHTLEVSQIGRTIARALGANCDLTESICLAHDLGHPAFGHSGEKTLAFLMKEYGGFDHNKQSLRIVTKLEKRYSRFPGLNLSWEVLEGIVKHETEYDMADAKDFNPDRRGNLEAQISNAADELAYTAHDLDDGLYSGMITPQMLEGIELWEILTSQLAIRNSILSDLDRHRLIRELIGMEVTDLVNQTTHNLKVNNPKDAAELQKMSHNVIAFSEPLITRNRQLKDFLFAKMYRNYRVMRMSEKAERIITDLFNAYKKEPGILPGHIKQNIDSVGLERIICDYLAGMTDRFAIEEHQKIFDPLVLP